jgi:hypothetical protein
VVLFVLESMSNHEEFLEIKIKYIEEEIDIRVESIKNEVEELGERLKEKLNEMKKDIFKYLLLLLIKI